MGNWRTVSMRGSLREDEVAAVRVFVTVDDDWMNFTPLSVTEGLAGLGNWPGAKIHADGNLAERDYSVEDVAETLRAIVGVAPSLALEVHCGSEYEDTHCVATITVADGQVTIGPPKVAEVSGASQLEIGMRLAHLLSRP